MAERKPVAWITKNGKHIPIFEDGQATKDADTKEKQIEENEKEADYMNQRSTVEWDDSNPKRYKVKGAAAGIKSARDMLGVRELDLYEAGRSATDTTYHIKTKDGQVAGRITEFRTAREGVMELYRAKPKKVGKMENWHSKAGEEEVKYEGVRMPRKEAKRIDKIKGDLGYLSYRGARTSLSESEKAEREKLQNELRKYGKKYNISVGWYLPGGK